MAGESPWNPVHPSSVAPETMDNTDPPDSFIAPFIQAPVVLVVSVDLEVVAALDQNLCRIGLVSGASVYPLVWNILLAARNEGYGGNLTSMAIPQEAQMRQLLSNPPTDQTTATNRRRNCHPRTLRRCTLHPPNTPPMTPRQRTATAHRMSRATNRHSRPAPTKTT